MLRAWPSAGLSLFVAPVGSGGVDVVFAEDFAGGAVDDGDGGWVGEQEDWLASVGVADAEVVHASGSAEGDLAAGVDVVDPDAVVVAVAGVWGAGFGGCVVGGGGGGGSVEGAVWPLGVVEALESDDWE